MKFFWTFTSVQNFLASAGYSTVLLVSVRYFTYPAVCVGMSPHAPFGHKGVLDVPLILNEKLLTPLSNDILFLSVTYYYRVLMRECYFFYILHKDCLLQEKKSCAQDVKIFFVIFVFVGQCVQCTSLSLEYLEIRYWRIKFLYSEWLNMNREIAYSKMWRCTNEDQIWNLGTHLDTIN